MHFPKNSRGMTFIELLTVVGIIIVVLALALPNFASMLRSQRWAAASGALQNALMRCRTYAVNDRRDHSIEICLDNQTKTQYFRLEVESTLLETIPELNAYYRNQADCLQVRLPRDWKQAFHAAGGTTTGETTHYVVNPNLRFLYEGPKYDVDGTAYRLAHRIKDNLKVDDHIFLPHSIKVDFAASTNLINYDKPPQKPGHLPQYGWDYTRDIRFNIAGVLVQARNPEIVLLNNAGEHMRLQILRSTARIRKLSGLN